ncbi:MULTISPECIES: hypothetical protein [unclassified Sulfitobacter]|uniref:hypothetical protein n=1 Tax=unclassified Sulfitobacter TaxID=196795 RepID=UPI0007C2609F|nr:MULTISPECIES: hypothetical protein [unclassified Sulfitobacter]KZY05245.1 hypothetical protein A3721_15040 [Sulfitobacter sp. HI0023]KZY25592.1 hypothetical protein A3728_18460 [Sulfitobacter sp. HI0040]KZZ68858.1 hypothetical protein A3764_12170 [Sulfitobacter sp. HI0129]
MNHRAIINSHMQALIDGFYHSLDAACEQINARNGSTVCKGTMSRRLNGDFGWPVEDVIALEDGAGRYPVTRRMANRLTDKERAAACIYEASGAASKEAGEAVSAALRAAQSADAGHTAGAIREAEEGMQALSDLRDSLTAHVQPIKRGAA